MNPAPSTRPRFVAFAPIAATCFALSVLVSPTLVATPWLAKITQAGPDSEGNRLPDYSYAGYRGPEVSTSTAPIQLPVGNGDVYRTLSPGGANVDDTARIQQAIDAAPAPLIPGGYTVVMLSQGVFRIQGTVRVNRSRVILRGSGAPNTLLMRPLSDPPNNDPIILVGGDSDSPFNEVPNTNTPITDDWVQVGSSTFNVQSATGFQVGDGIVIVHPASAAWLNLVDPGNQWGWRNDGLDIRYYRQISRISGSTITIDAPVYNHLKKAVSACYIAKYNRAAVVKEVGVENLTVQQPAIREATGNIADVKTHGVRLRNAQDCWVYGCASKGFSGVGFFVGQKASRITVLNCEASEPNLRWDPAKPPRTEWIGGFGYNFCTQGGQLVLFQNCWALDGRHSFVCNGTTDDSGVVFQNCTIVGPLNIAHPHQRWSQGILYDNVTVASRDSSFDWQFMFELANDGPGGTGHGWDSVHSALWNCNAVPPAGSAGGGQGGYILLQKPPTGQNYAVGCNATVTNVSPEPRVGTQPAGYKEGINQSPLGTIATEVIPRSLYLNQLAKRRGRPSVVAIDLTKTSNATTNRTDKARFLNQVDTGDNSVIFADPGSIPANATSGDWVTYPITVSVAGYYKLVLMTQRYTWLGAFQLSVASNNASPWTGAPVDGPKDCSGAENKTWSIPFTQTLAFAAGETKYLRFTAVKSASQPAGAKFVLDNLVLVPLADPSLPPLFTTVPVYRSAAMGNKVTFTAVPTGMLAPTFQWQVSTDAGATWNNLSDGRLISNAKTIKLTVTADSATNQNQFRVVARNSIENIISPSATLTVGAAAAAPPVGPRPPPPNRPID